MDRPRNWFDRRWWLFATTAVVILIYNTYMWFSIRGLPNTIRETQPGPWVQHSVDWNYAIDLSPGALYPDGLTVGPEQKAIPINLFSQAKVFLTDDITSEGLEVTSLEYEIDLLVSAEDLWQRSYELITRQPTDEGMSQIRCEFDLPIESLAADIAEISREIGMGSPNGDYQIAVRFQTWVGVRDPEPKVYEYAPTATFTLTRSGLMLDLPVDELSPVERYALDMEVERTNSRRFLGREMNVVDLKQTTTSILGMVVAAQIPVMLWAIKASRLSTSKADRKRDPARDYRSRLIAAAHLDVDNSQVIVRVKGLKELARIADEAQATIMELDSSAKPILSELEFQPNPELQGRRFFTVIGGTVYYVV